MFLSSLGSFAALRVLEKRAQQLNIIWSDRARENSCGIQNEPLSRACWNKSLECAKRASLKCCGLACR